MNMTTENRYYSSLENVRDCAASVLDAIQNDMADDEHRDHNGHSNVVEWRVCPARDCFTSDFNELMHKLSDAIRESDDALKNL